MPDNPERFDQICTVLGTQVFTCGRHYWEVEVGNKTEWEVGICKDSVSRKGNLTSLLGILFSLIGLKIGDDYSLWVLVTFGKANFVREPVHRLAFLRLWRSRTYAFYNVTDESLIYKLPCSLFPRGSQAHLLPLVSQTKGPTQALLSSVL